MCTVLVTGLGGLYSLLPNTIEIVTVDWHRITSDDVAEIAELTAFMNALEFCNAVVQVAHDLIREQLLDVMYLGFIIPVLGPALLQVVFHGQETRVLSYVGVWLVVDFGLVVVFKSSLHICGLTLLVVFCMSPGNTPVRILSKHA